MIWTNIKRILRAGFIGFWRNGFVSFATVLIMTVTLFVIGAVVFLGAMLNVSLAELKDKVDINVYFLTDAPEEDILSLKSAIEGLPETAEVAYVSREEALDAFRTRHENDQLTLQALDELDENPLGAILTIKARETSQYESIANFLEGDTALGSERVPIIDKVNFFQNKTAIEKLSRIIDSAERLGFIISIILVFISVIITFNTIRLAIYTSREEISVMRLVGASSAYTRGPFVVGGILYGVIAGVVTLLLFYPITFWLGPYTEGFFSSINLFSYYGQNFGQIFVLIIGSGIVLGGISSYLAVRKYLQI